VAIVDAAHCLYYANFPNPTFQDLEMLVLLNNKAMENVQKEHMIAFYKRLLVCDPTFSPEFLKQIQIHYNMNLDPEMMTEKLQLLMSLQVNNEQKVYWFK
jgi:hypothetical protein